MSEIRVTTLKDTSGGNSSTTEQIASGRAKAWVNFNGSSTVAIRANFNVNSITDKGTGDYDVNFSTSMGDANYAIAGTGASGGGDGIILFVASANTTPTAALVRVRTVNTSTTPIDANWYSVTIHD